MNLTDSTAFAVPIPGAPAPRPTVPAAAEEAEIVILDPTGFDEFYRREHEPMARLAFLLCGDRDVAAEVVHDAFVVTYERWGKLDRPGGYLRTAVVNKCRDLGRRQRFRSARPVPERSAHDPRDAELVDAVAALPPKRRAAVVLRYYADLSEADIAATLGVRPGTVKSLLSRGLGELRAALADPSSDSDTLEDANA